MSERPYYVFILANAIRALYVGVTDELVRGVTEHLNTHTLTSLVYFEECGKIDDALARERQINGWPHAMKVALVESLNPEWEDLSAPAPQAL